ncbi:MAG: hypothetical protein PHD48_03615 [Alphaproteobacteria bacterium]|nr:hypothetical protein [Alphaproteobacteria bacterium]
MTSYYEYSWSKLDTFLDETLAETRGRAARLAEEVKEVQQFQRDAQARFDRALQEYPFLDKSGTLLPPEKLNQKHRDSFVRIKPWSITSWLLFGQESQTLLAYKSVARSGDLPDKKSSIILGWPLRFLRRKVARKGIQTKWTHTDFSQEAYDKVIAAQREQGNRDASVQFAQSQLQYSSTSLAYYEEIQERAARLKVALAGQNIPAPLFNAEKDFVEDLRTCLTLKEQKDRSIIYQATKRSNQKIIDYLVVQSKIQIIEAPEILDKIKEYLSYSKNGKLLLDKAEASGYKIQLYQYEGLEHLDGPGIALGRHDAKIKTIGILVHPELRLRELGQAETLSHELAHMDNALNLGLKTCMDSKVESPLLYSRLIEAAANAVMAVVTDEMYQGLAKKLDMPYSHPFRHQFEQDYGHNAMALRSFFSSLKGEEGRGDYDALCLDGFAALEVCGKWDETVESYSLLQPKNLEQLTILPDGQSFMPKRLMRLIPALVGKVDYPKITIKQKGPEKPVGGFLLSKRREPLSFRPSRHL